MATPHNHAKQGEIAKTVLMPGDPLRAKFIAETFLKDVKQFNSVRNMFGYTGTYEGKEVSVMGSGMGMPSIGIYSYELYSQYDVENIIRIGSAGSYCEQAKVFDVVLADSAYSESSFAKTQSGYEKDKTFPSEQLNERIRKSAKELGIPMIEGCVHSSDVFYREDKTPYYKDLHEQKGCVCVEMESFALFHNASVLGKQAACLLTISDSFVSSQITTAEERQKSFTDMMKIALHAAINL
ncbi:MAG: purine-nucleoside phosphorylase [Lachnospiraceae bacterium]|nr:purine-nucleoside phosphorylase [Lachnospiraceae bacterium]